MTNSKGSRVLIVGCGELGSRHLQAIASLPQVTEIEVVDPRPEGLQLGRERLDEARGPDSFHSVKWFGSIDQATPHGDLCIIATPAKGRGNLLRSITQKLNYANFILEKMASQSILEMEEAEAFARDQHLSVWVNCQTRANSFYQRVKDQLGSNLPVILSASGCGQFLATNGIHAADLFAYYSNGKIIEASGSWIDPVLHPSRRGEGLFDLTGSLYGHTVSGSTLSIVYAPGSEVWAHTSIASPEYRCVVDHFLNWSWEADAASGWKWRPAPDGSNLFVSHTTQAIAADILTKGECGLPSIKEALISHRFILDSLQPHFQSLLGQELEHCPVT